jgi:hypothetical protein
MVKSSFAFAALCLVSVGLLLFCGTGCAKNYVLSDNRVALWAAAQTAVIESGYEVTRSDEPKGVIAGMKSMRRDEKVVEKSRLTLAIDMTGGRYRATVTVKRSGPPVDYTATDIGFRHERTSTGGRGRVANQYGTVANRDFGEEKAVLARIRELLSQPAAGAAPPVTSP